MHAYGRHLCCVGWAFPFALVAFFWEAKGHDMVSTGAAPFSVVVFVKKSWKVDEKAFDGPEAHTQMAIKKFQSRGGKLKQMQPPIFQERRVLPWVGVG